MSFISERSTLLRSLAAGGALVGALATASSASAALDSGTPARFTTRPNLVSVSASTEDIVVFQFDRAVQQGTNFSAAAFHLGGYRASEGDDLGTAVSGSTVARVSASDPTKVLLTTNADVNNRTFGAVQAGAVRGTGISNNENLADATYIAGATGESGTRGHTTGPDLESAVVNSDANSITYVFDQAVDANTAGFAQFGFVNVNGDAIRGTTVGPSGGANVTVQFAQGDDVDTARQAFYGQNLGATAITASGNPGAPYVSVPIAGKTSTTVAPLLTSAELEVSTGTIVYTFDQNITGTDIDETGFLAVLSNGMTVPGTGAVVANGNQVRVTYDTSQFDEHDVFASVVGGTVRGINGGVLNAPTGKPVGGNVGAKATGYTTAPDAMSATFNRTTGQVTVLFDSRFNSSTVPIGGFQLLADDGTLINNAAGAGPSTATAERSTVPAQSRVILQFTPQQVAVASVIRVRGYAVVGGKYQVDGLNAVTGTIRDFPAASVFTNRVGGVLAGAALSDAGNVETLVVPTVTARKFAK